MSPATHFLAVGDIFIAIQFAEQHRVEYSFDTLDLYQGIARIHCMCFQFVFLIDFKFVLVVNYPPPKGGELRVVPSTPSLA